MVKVPLNTGKDLLQALSKQGESSSTKTRVLFVEDEMYGPMEFPKSFILGRGQVLKLAAYGKVQVQAVTIDTLHCTKEIHEELYDEYRRNPPTSDIDFTNDPATGGISADISRSIELHGVAMGEKVTGRTPAREVKPPHPTDSGSRETPMRFL